MRQRIENDGADSTPDLKTARTVAGPLLGSLASAVLFLVLFGWLAEEVFEGELRQFDLRARDLVHQFASPLVTKIALGITKLGAGAPLAILFGVAVAYFLATKHRGAAAWLVVAMSGMLVLDRTLKLAFHRTRPETFFGPTPTSYSFPSGHALGSFVFYGVIAGLLSARIRSRPLRALIWSVAALLVTAIGLSRIYLGVHYPTDVIAGYFAGAVWVSTLLFADRFHLQRAARRKLQSRASQPRTN